MGKTPKTKIKNWEDDIWVQKWFAKVKSEISKKNHRYMFTKFLDHIQMTPTEMIEKRMKDLQSTDPTIRGYFEDRIIEWVNELAKTMRASSIHTLVGSVQSFFSKNRLPLAFSKGDLAVKTTKQPLRVEIPSNDEVRAIYSLSPLNIKIAILLSYQSGFDSNDIVYMKLDELGDLDGEKNNVVIRKRKKTSELHMTCISYENAHDIELSKKAKPDRTYVVETQQGNQFKSEKLNLRFAEISKKATGKRFIFKSLRKAYKRALNECKPPIDEEMKKVMFGHTTGIENHYSKWETNEKPILEAYEKVIQLISINGARRVRNDLKQLRDAVLALQKDVATYRTINEQIMQSHLKQNQHNKNVATTFKEVLSILKELPFDEKAKKKITRIDETLDKIKTEAEKYD